MAAASTVSEAAAGLGIAVVGVTGAGAAGALPTPVQDPVARAVETVSPFDLPDPADAAGTDHSGTGSPDDADDVAGTDDSDTPAQEAREAARDAEEAAREAQRAADEQAREAEKRAREAEGEARKAAEEAEKEARKAAEREAERSSGDDRGRGSDGDRAHRPVVTSGAPEGSPRSDATAPRASGTAPGRGVVR